MYAFRGEKPIPFESTLERDFLVRQEFFLHVLDVVPQPCRIPFVGANGQAFTYTPDFLVRYRRGNPKPLLVEVKPEKEWREHWREWLPKWKAARRYARARGWAFHVHDESRIRDHALENIRFLERYKRVRFPAEECLPVVDDARRIGAVSLHQLLARHFTGMPKADGLARVWHLLAARRLDCDIARPLNDATMLWVPTDA